MRFFLVMWLMSFLQCDLKKNHDKNVNSRSQAGREVPILCYHNIRSVLDHHSPELTVTERTFDDQMKTLHDEGYHTILPDDLYNYLTKGSPLPSKPIMISFDDSHEEHFSIAAKQMEKYGFKGVFFVMTIVIDKHFYRRQRIFYVQISIGTKAKKQLLIIESSFCFCIQHISLFGKCVVHQHHIFGSFQLWKMRLQTAFA